MLFKVKLYVPSLNKDVIRYVEATSGYTAQVLAEGCFNGMAVVKSTVPSAELDVNGYVIIPTSKAQW